MSKTLLIIMIGLSVLVLVTGGCTTAQKKETAAAAAEEPYRLESEGEVPPLAESDVRKEVDKTETFEELPVADEAVVVENVEPPPVEMKKATAETGRKTMNGYRVQVMASSSPDAAESVRSAVASKTGAPAYVDLVDGVYKVRVGDCATRADAEALRDLCRRSGYADAWIVSGKIFMPERTDGR
jgi:hypothetical protein